MPSLHAIALFLSLALPMTACVAPAATVQAAPPRLFNIDQMPRVDVHVHLHGGTPHETLPKYIETMDAVDLDVTVFLGAPRAYIDQIQEIKRDYAGRILLAHRPNLRREGVPPRDELATMKERGMVGSKLWLGYSPLIKDEQFGRSLGDLGAVGLPVIGMHIADPPSGKTAPERFEAQIDHTLAQVEANPDTTFIMAHGFWLMTGDKWLDKLDAAFERYPNLYVEIAAAGQAFGGADLTHSKLRDFFIKHQDRILFGTDGNPEYAREQRHYYFYYRLLETDQTDQRAFFGGQLGIDGLALPLETLNHLYWWNAARLIPAVHDALLARGYPIDEPIEQAPAPRITNILVSVDSMQPTLWVETDTPADVRWSFTNQPYPRMSDERTLAAGDDGTTHQVTLESLMSFSEGRKGIVYVSAAHEDGLAMTTATPIALFPNAEPLPPMPTAGGLGYQVLAWDSFDDAGAAAGGWRFDHPGQPFREVYLRFRAKFDAMPEAGTPLWAFSFDPSSAYDPEHRVGASVGPDTYTTTFEMAELIELAGDEGVIKPGQWQEHVIRFNVQSDQFEARVDGQLVLESEHPHLSGMWGGGFDTVRLVDDVAGVQIDDVLILGGSRAAAFDDERLPDDQAPTITETYPLDGATGVDPGASIVVGFSEIGMGLDSERVELTLNGQAAPAQALGLLHGGYIVFKPAKGLEPGEVEARIRVRDMNRPAHESERVWSFTVADAAIESGETNLALGREPIVDSTYEDRRDPYVMESLTDGEIAPLGGSRTTWVSGSPAREDQWVAVDFGEVRAVTEARVYPVVNRGVYMTPQVLIIEAWDGEAYRPVGASYASEPAAHTAVRFPAVETQRLRIRRPPFMGSPHYNPLWLTEVQMFGPASNNGT